MYIHKGVKIKYVGTFIKDVALFMDNGPPRLFKKEGAGGQAVPL